MGKRPLGVTIIVILTVLGAIFSLGMILPALLYGTLIIEGLTAELQMAMYLTSVYLVCAGIVSLIIAWGLWNMEHWAYVITMILNSLSIVVNIATALIYTSAGAFYFPTGIIIPVIIVCYLYYIRELFD